LASESLQGDSLHVTIGSANRDPRYVEHPDEADLRRSGPWPLSYSQGAYRCLGAALGATEIAALLPALLGALGTWRFADPLPEDVIPGLRDHVGHAWCACPVSRAGERSVGQRPVRSHGGQDAPLS
jgi:hypothetical protein